VTEKQPVHIEFRPCDCEACRVHRAIMQAGVDVIVQKIDREIMANLPLEPK
jgi:hypothetical protein